MFFGPWIQQHSRLAKHSRLAAFIQNIQHTAAQNMQMPGRLGHVVRRSPANMPGKKNPRG